MQMQPFIMPIPSGADRVGLFQDQTREAGLFEASSDRQARGPGADNNRLALNCIVTTGHWGRRVLRSEAGSIPLGV